ncbi:MAG TPA: serine/threonine-protein kinase [Kofleriaceae bacterium]|jgi:serine/threonine protein kinase
MKVGNYELVTQLATGGMAETHIARSVDNTIVVIKQLLPKFAGNAEFIEMFVDEGRVISSLRHPNIVAMREFGFHDELPFLALEYLHGVDLRTLTRTLALRKKQAMPIDVAMYIACAMCAGLHHAHEARTIDGKPMDITHRDVSPQNVVMTFDGEVKLIDFGIATARGRSHETRSGALKGKIPYMAPEQVRAGATDRRTDIYATAVVLYEMLASRRPYVGKRKRMGEFSLMMAIVNHDVVPVDTIRTDIPPTLVKVLGKAMALDPEQRYQTAAELEQALRGEAKRLGISLVPQRLTNVMVDVLGDRKKGTDGRTNAEVMALVSETEHAKTIVNESLDPPTQDVSELKSSSSSHQLAKATNKGMPAFDDIVDLEAEAAAAAAAMTSTGQGLPVDKIVERDHTKLKFTRTIEPGFRWARILDGIEGALEIDFSGAGDLSVTVVAAASVAIHGLSSDVSQIRLIAVPIGLATQIDDRCEVISVSCAGQCPSCNKPSIAILAYDEIRQRLMNGDDIPCSVCGAGLANIELSPLATWAARPSGRMPALQRDSDQTAAQLGHAPTASMAATAMGSAQIPTPTIPTTPPVSKRPSVQMRPVHKKWLPAYIGVGVFAVALAAGAITLALRAKRPAVASIPPAGTGNGTPWNDGDTWRVDAKGEGPDEASAFAAARHAAMKELLLEVEHDLPSTIRELAPSSKDDAAISDFQSHDVARRLEMLASSTDRRADGVHVTTSYKTARSGIEAARAYYATVKMAWGVELINAPPSSPPGVLVLTAGSGAVARGDRIVSAGGQPLTSLASVTPELLAHETLDLVVEHVERKKLQVQSVEAK